MALRGARGAQFLLDDSGRIAGYIDGNGIERNMAGDPITPGSTPLPGAFRQSGLVMQSAVAASVTGTLTETVLATIAIPAGAMGVNGAIRVWALFSTPTNTVSSKAVRASINGAIFLEGNLNNGLTLDATKMIRNRGASNSQVKHQSTSVGSISTVAVTTSAVDFTVAQNLVLTGTLANTGETITLEGYSVEILNP